jgi:peptidase M15-like protein
VPPRSSRERAQHFAGLLYDLQQQHPFSGTSHWRTFDRNKAVGGGKRSFHLDGCAEDCVPAMLRPWGEFVAAARALGLDAVDEGDHVHVEYDFRRVEE